MENKTETSKTERAVLVTFTPEELEAMKRKTCASNNAEAVRITIRKSLAEDAK